MKIFIIIDTEFHMGVDCFDFVEHTSTDILSLDLQYPLTISEFQSIDVLDDYLDISVVGSTGVTISLTGYTYMVMNESDFIKSKLTHPQFHTMLREKDASIIPEIPPKHTSI